MDSIEMNSIDVPKQLAKQEMTYGSLGNESTFKSGLNGLLMLSKKTSDSTKFSNEQIDQCLSIDSSIFLTPCPSPIQGRSIDLSDVFDSF